MIVTLGTSLESPGSRSNLSNPRAAVSGVVQEITKDKVVIHKRGGNQNVPSNMIGWIVFEGTQAPSPRSKEFVSKGQFEESLVELRKLDPASLKSDYSKKELEFYRAFAEGKLAILGKGDAAKSVESLLAFVSANKDSNHFYECTELLVELAVQLRDKDKALRPSLVALSRALFKEVAIRSRYLEARALLAQNKFAEAKKARVK